MEKADSELADASAQLLSWMCSPKRSAYIMNELEIFFRISRSELSEWLSLSSEDWRAFTDEPQMKLPDRLIEEIDSLTAIFVAGRQYFADEGRWQKWLATRNRVLGDRTPFECLASARYRDLVRELIGQMENGFVV